MEPSQLGSLNGLIRTKDTERFILVRPLAVKVKPSPVDVVLLGFDDQGAKYASLALDLLFSCPKPSPGHLLIYTG